MKGRAVSARYSEGITTAAYLNEKENKIQSIFRAAPVGIGMVIDRVIIEANDTLCSMTGYSAKELIGSNSKMLYPTEKEYNSVGLEKYGIKKEKGNGTVETRWKKKNGNIINILLSSSALDLNDPSKGITFTALDITERKLFEENIRMRDLQLNYIATNIPATLYQYYVKDSGENGFYYISESSEQIFGIKNNPDDFFERFASHVSPEYKKEFFESINYSVTNRTPWDFDGIFVKDSGEPLWFRCMANPVLLKDETVYYGIGINITEKMKLLQLSERANRLDSLAILAGGIAHDFNNILGGIFGYIEMARNYSSADRIVSGYLDNALQIFDRTKHLTGQLLTFAKGGEPVKKFGSISSSLIEITRFLMKDSKLSYEFSFPEDLFICEFDSQQLCQAFENIITNAIQAMPAGGSLRVSAENTCISPRQDSFLKAGNYVKISIRDSGTGIPGEIIPKIFDPFFTTKQRCIGMGLSTCHSIITRHGGSIDVDSSPGKGAAFYIYLPATEKKFELNNYRNNTTHSGKGDILIMDDEVFIRETVGEMLKIMGYNVYKAADGNEALTTLAETGHNITAVILDLTVQNGMGGRETMERIKKMGFSSPVFASSGYSDDPVISTPRNFGFTDSIRKPYRMEDLASLLNFYLE